MIPTPVSPSAHTGAAPVDAAALLDAFIDSQPAAALEAVRSLVSGAAPARRATAERLSEAIAADQRLDDDVNRIASDASRAQEVFENWTDERVDGLLRDLAEAFAHAAENLAIAAVEETGLGNVHDKTLKNRFARMGIYESLAGKIAQGTLSIDTTRGVTELACPVGVVFAIVPVTNPAATAIFKTLITLKARNAVILSFHRHAFLVGQLTGAIVQDVLAAHGAPRNLVQVVGHRAGRQATRKFMSHPKISLILATVRVEGRRVYVVFDGPARAIRCGCAISAEARTSKMTVRVGLHTGECDMVAGVPHGGVVDVGRRVAACAKSGEVFVTRTVVDLVAGSGLEFSDRGTHSLSKTHKAWRVYAVRVGESIGEPAHGSRRVRPSTKES